MNKEVWDSYQERYDLVMDRIAEIPSEEILTGNVKAYFDIVANYMLDIRDLLDTVSTGKLDQFTLEEHQALQDKYYGPMKKENYEESFLNPAYAVSELGEYGGILSMVYAELTDLIPQCFEERIDLVTIYAELFVEIYGVFTSSDKILEGVKDSVYYFHHDYSELFVGESIERMVEPAYDFFKKIIMESDLTDLRYLYQYGSYISDNEIKMAKYLNTLSEEEVQSMADTYTEGYRIGFAASNKDIKKKKTVKVEFPIGMERMARLAVKNFEKIGLESIIIRGKKRNVYGTSVNRQFEYDHKDDRGYYFNKGYVERALEVMKTAFEEHAAAARVLGGPAVVDAFGEEDFHPVNKKESYSFDDKQNELQVYYQSKAGELNNTYIPGDERSFTIIAYPLPSIGEQFEEIFRETVKLNTLDYVLYRDMQQKLIDTLDQGYAVRVKGTNGNTTDIVVQLHPLQNPQKETIFENCVADVNIPVGEVFTSPVLEGTNGILNVSKVYLGAYSYDNMTLKFEDGVVREYSCDNFENPEEGKKLIYDNVMFRHEFLPLGEFAIGTNTTAFVMARKFKIEDKMPILIAEKTGPHFAVGDTCYSHAEEVPMYNPDGKEVVARSNTYADLRDTDPQKAYFNCHTDITIPYDELGEITVLCKDGREIPIILNGRFVVPGTEELNKPLDEQ